MRMYKFVFVQTHVLANIIWVEMYGHFIDTKFLAPYLNSVLSCVNRISSDFCPREGVILSNKDHAIAIFTFI